MSVDISVIIPCYNVEDYVEECLDSVVSQFAEGLELIVIDDASTDGTWQRLSKYRDLPFIHLLRFENNLGLGAVRNKGIELSRGEYLLFLDSDDWLADGTLIKLVRSSKENPADITFFHYARVYEKFGAFSDPNNWLFERVSKSIVSHREKILLLDFPTMAWFKLYRREFVINSGVVFGEGYYEDVSWTYPLTILATKIQMLPIVVYYYRQRRGSILKRKDDRHLDLLSEYEKIFAHCRELEDDEYRKKITSKAIEHHVFILFGSSGRLSCAGLRKYFLKANSQLLKLDRADVDDAIAKTSGNTVRQKVLLSGNFGLYFCVFLFARLSHLLRKPFNLYKAYLSGRRLRI